jgi:hypothetical protein
VAQEAVVLVSTLRTKRCPDTRSIQDLPLIGSGTTEVKATIRLEVQLKLKSPNRA